MKNKLLIASLVLISTITLAGCSNPNSISNSKQADCEKACDLVPSEQKDLCMSTCEKAAKQYENQNKTETTSNGKTNSQCERFDGMAKNSCYMGLAMDEKEPAYCDNIENSAERSECKDNIE